MTASQHCVVTQLVARVAHELRQEAARLKLEATRLHGMMPFDRLSLTSRAEAMLGVVESIQASAATLLIQADRLDGKGR